MPEEFGTINLKRDDSREIDLLRRHYRTHRDTLGRLVGDAPSTFLAAEYQRLIGEIDNALLKLDELEGRKPPVNTDTNPAVRTTGPGTRPLVRTADAGSTSAAGERLGSAPSARSRIAFIVVAAIIVLAIIGWLIWRASLERAQPAPVVEQPITNTTTNAAPPPAVTPAPAPTAAPLGLTVTPAAADYGVIRRGTRAVRQYEISNSGATLLEIAVARSACRCLYYDYNNKLPANGKESITVTVDGARAKPGPLLEQVEIHAKKDPTIKATFEVRATIR